MTGEPLSECGRLAGAGRTQAVQALGVSACVMIGLLAGCEAQQTHIVSTTRYPDGTEVRYANMSSGYGYNPNVNVDVSVHSDGSVTPRDVAPRLPARPVGVTGEGPAPVTYASPAAMPVAVVSPGAVTAVAARLDGSGYVNVPLPVVPMPLIAPANTGVYWGPSPWATGMNVMPAMPAAYGAGVYGPPIPNFGFGCR